MKCTVIDFLNLQIIHKRWFLVHIDRQIVPTLTCSDVAFQYLCFRCFFLSTPVCTEQKLSHCHSAEMKGWQHFWKRWHLLTDRWDNKEAHQSETRNAEKEVLICACISFLFSLFSRFKLSFLSLLFSYLWFDYIPTRQYVHGHKHLDTCRERGQRRPL